MATRKSSKNYGSAASRSVEREIKEMNKGTLKSGRSGKKVTERKQAIAIGLSEARKAGAKVPSAPAKTAKNTVAKKATKKSAAKKTPAKKTATKKSSAKKATKKSAKK
jgi:hypothetical protein